MSEHGGVCQEPDFARLEDEALHGHTVSTVVWRTVGWSVVLVTALVARPMRVNRRVTRVLRDTVPGRMKMCMGCHGKAN